MNQKSHLRKLIIALSILIPVVVAVLFRVKITGYDFSFLPPIYASINGLTAVLLIVAIIAIKSGQRSVHEYLMKLCIGLSASFLIMYVLYHMTTESTSYGGEGIIRYCYYAILISHILLSMGVVPMVLFTFLYALSGDFTRHRKLAKYTFPVWVYVSVTGVIVYLMISPYYA